MGRSNKQEHKKQKQEIKYVGAPYNFVPFSKEVYHYPKEKLTAHNDMKEELYTGEIAYEITAETPIIVSDGKRKNEPEEFHKDAQGRYAIPGSTMRGLIRNNVQILGLSGFNEDIDDYALMYRAVAGGIEKGRYNEILGAKQITIDKGNIKVGVLKNVKAGYITKEAEKYVIYKTCVDSIKKEYGEMNYYILSERKVVQEYLNSRKNGSKFGYSFFIEKDEKGKEKSKMQHEIEAEFKKETDKYNRVHWKGKKNQDYKPYYGKVSYKIANTKDVVAVGNEDMYKSIGYVMSTGKMNEKKVIYIIPEIDKSKSKIEISKKDIFAFKADIEKKKNTLGQFGGREFFDLPKDGEVKPVFYIELGNRLYFGFTPRLRLFYDNTIKAGLPENHKDEGIDYSKAIFGYSNKDGSYKSKVSFSDAVNQSVSMAIEKKIEKKQVILSEPKPSSYSDYLSPQKIEDSTPQAVTYNKDGFELRGVKQYWLHKNAEDCEGDEKNKKICTNIRPLPAGTKFQGKVRFQNLSKDELGLLLWSIKLQDSSWMNIGKAKAYGYGNISVEILEAKRLDMGKAYNLQGLLELEPFEKIDVGQCIQYYKDTINEFLSGRKIDDLPHIKDFFKMKDSTVIPDKDKIRYMNINKKEYQSRQAVLPSIDETIGKGK